MLKTEKNEILKMIHSRCPRGFWVDENINEQNKYIITIVEEVLNIKTAAAYICLFNINDLRKINSSIITKYGMSSVYELLEVYFNVPSFMLAAMKNVPRNKKVEYNDFLMRISTLADYDLISLYGDINLTTKDTSYKWYNLFDEHQAKIICKFYNSRTEYNNFINRMFYDYSDSELQSEAAITSDEVSETGYNYLV